MSSVDAIDVPFLERLQHRFARRVFGQNVAVAHVRGDMVRAGLERQLVSLLQRQVDEALGRQPPMESFSVFDRGASGIS